MAVGSQVETGAPLVRLEPTGDEDEAAEAAASESVDLDLPDCAGARRDAPVSAPTAASATSPRRARLRRRSRRRSAPARVLPRPRATSSPPRGRCRIGEEIAVLELVADFAELSRNRPVDAGAAHRAARAQPQGALPHLPAEPRRRAGRAARRVPRQARPRAAPLRHHRLRAHARSSRRPSSGSSSHSSARPPRSSSPPRSCSAGSASPHPSEQEGAAARDALDRLVVATQLRFPVVGDLARSVRFRWFDQPLVDQERASVLAGVSDRLAALAAEPDAPDHAAARRRARLDPRADRALPRRPAARRARRRPAGARADARGAHPAALPRARAARAAHLHRGRPALRRGRLHPRRPPHPPHLDDRCGLRARAGQRPRHGRLGRRLGPARGPPLRRRPLPQLAGGAGVARRGERPARRAAAGPALHPRGAAGGGRDEPRRGTARSPTSPSARARGASSRTASCAGCTRWSAAGSTSGASRRST